MTVTPSPVPMTIEQLPVPLERDDFLRDLIRELSGTLQNVVGLEEASGFISVVGQRIGDQINDSYRQALQLDKLSRDQVAEVLVDLKRRIRGSFRIVEQNDERIVLANADCPFAEKVIGRPDARATHRRHAQAPRLHCWRCGYSTATSRPTSSCC